jgi:ribonuclease HI
MLKALELAREHKATRLVCHGDSELIIFQLQGRYRIKDARLKVLAEKVKSAAVAFEAVTWKQVPREHAMIARADKLLNQALDRAKTGTPEHTPSPESVQGEFFK